MSAREPKRQPSAAEVIARLEADVQKLEAAIDELRTRLRKEEAHHSDELRQFSYAVSHDLREPLRMIASYSQLLDRRYSNQLDADGRDFIGFIVDAVHRMEQLLVDLLTYSHQFRPLEMPPALIDPEVVLETVLLTIEKEIKQSGAKIAHDPLPKITFDFGRLTQLFLQLITNSIKFRGTETARIHVAAREAEGETIFSVRDNGLGIDARYHEQIFGIFRRLHGNEKPGTGMGLAICKRIVEQQGGRIWVESEADKGAVFHFTVPQ
ncbi:MAG TPA: ATP-binding protein [Bryobacteraceae bacterium]|nr:ATP-binding protein [Bryobacteraceae bacterium]